MATSQTGRTIVNIGVKVTLPNWARGGTPTTAGDPPTMTQIADSAKEFRFPYRPLPIQHEGYGPEFSEIERPYNTPLLEIKSGKLRRFNFEVPLAIQDDSLSVAIDDNMERLKEMADDGIPVRFIKMAPSITSTNWYISELSFNQDRTLISGPTVRFTAQMSFVEYSPYRPKFVFLRPISYGVPTDKVAKKTVETSAGTFPIDQMGIGVQGGKVVDTTKTGQ